MNRADKRILAREHQKIEKREVKKQKDLMNWFHSWNPDQKQFHKNMVSAMLDEVNEITEKVLDTSYIAAMIEKLDISLEQCEEVAEQANIYMIEVKKIIDEKKEGYFKMIKDEKLKQEIKEEAKIIIKENTKINNLRVIDALKENYKLPSKDLQIIIKEARKELEAEIMKEIEKSIDKEPSKVDSVRNEVNKIKATLANEGEHGFEITLDASAIKPNGLRVKFVEIEGEFANYRKGSEGIEIIGSGKEIYRDISEVEKEEKESQEQFKTSKEEMESQIKALKEEIEKITNTKVNLEKVEQNKINMLAEIKAVFAIKG